MENKWFRIVTKKSNLSNEKVYSIERLNLQGDWVPLGEPEQGILKIRDTKLAREFLENQRKVYYSRYQAEHAIELYLQHKNDSEWTIVTENVA